MKKLLNFLKTISFMDLNIYEYKVLLLLCNNELTQTQLADFLETYRQHTNKIVKKLLDLNLIVQTKKIGTSIYYTSNLDFKN